MTTTIYVSRDASALAMGADRVARAIADHAAHYKTDVRIVRNGSRGMFWLEPLVEVAVGDRRIAYGPVQPKDVDGLFAANFTTGASHVLRLGAVEDIPYFRKQERLTFARVGLTDPLSLDDYRARDGLRGLQKALEMAPADIVKTVTDSGLRGRGGAAFPAGIKWKTALDAPVQPSAHSPRPCKYIVCNADEGDSGTFSDRMLMEGDPFVLIEGMIIAGLAVGATHGYIYLRCEYPHAHEALKAAIAAAYANQILGDDILGSGKRFDLEVRLGAGAYLRRGDLAARQSRRQARTGAGEAAAAGDPGTVRPADDHQQRHYPRERADHPRQGRGVLPRLRHGPLARHAAAATGWQHPARWVGRKGVRPDPAGAVVRLWRRLGVGTPDTCRAGRRAAGVVPA